LSELSTQVNNQVAYKEFIPVIADILHAYERNLALNEEWHKMEDEAHHKADRIVRSTAIDIQHIVDFLKDRIRVVTDTIETSKQQYQALQEILFNPHSGLSRTEANALLEKILPHDSHTRLRNLKLIPLAMPGHHSSSSIIIHRTNSEDSNEALNLGDLTKAMNQINEHAPVISKKKGKASLKSRKSMKGPSKLSMDASVKSEENVHHDNHHDYHHNDNHHNTQHNAHHKQCHIELL
jgi:hypothetical protein